MTKRDKLLKRLDEEVKELRLERDRLHDKRWKALTEIGRVEGRGDKGKIEWYKWKNKYDEYDRKYNNVLVKLESYAEVMLIVKEEV